MQTRMFGGLQIRNSQVRFTQKPENATKHASLGILDLF